jgi:hypothetical protein
MTPPPIWPGESQAEALGEHWAPLLHDKAASGQLHVFVSPMVRPDEGGAACQSASSHSVLYTKALRMTADASRE